VPAAGDWDRAALSSGSRPYLDPAMAEVKQSSHLRLLGEWLPDLTGAAILKTDLWEEGIAGDELLFTLGSRARVAHGVDISEHVVERARERAPAALDLELVPARLTELPYEDDTIDAVVSTSTIDHLPVPERLPALLELRRVMAPGGVLVITCDNSSNLGDPLLALCARVGVVPFPLDDSLTLDELRDLASLAGFECTGHAYLVHGPRVVTTAIVRALRLVGGDRAVRATLRALEAAGRRFPRRLGAFVAVRATA
jgi:SAM-dependent methyltransferase